MTRPTPTRPPRVRTFADYRVGKVAPTTESAACSAARGVVECRLIVTSWLRGRRTGDIDQMLYDFEMALYRRAEELRIERRRQRCGRKK